MNKEEAIEKLKTELKLKGFSPLTVKNYSYFIEKFLSSSSKSIEELNEEDAKSYLASLIDSKSRATLSLVASSIRFFYNLLGKQIGQIVLPKKEKKLPVVLTREEVKKLVESTDTRKSKLILSLLYSSGLRVSELVNLKKEDIDFGENLGWVRKGKGGKDRLFSISETLVKEIKNYISVIPENTYLFSKLKPLTTRNIQKIIQSTSKKVPIHKKVTPHTLRHSFATHLLESGVDIRVIQTLLGHENLQTTQIYTHISQDQIKKVKNPFDSL
ncbi:MAG: site-specific tyrosine recombinase/integron integrase [archaeon]